MPEPPADLPPGVDPERIAAPGSASWPDHLRAFAESEPSPRRAQLHRTANAIRHIIDRLHGSPAPDRELAAVADELERLARRLDAFPGGSLYEGFGESPLAGRDPHAFFDHSPMLGRANPLAPPVELWADGGVMRGRATFGSAYEGPPGCVHGGYIAAAFDEVLGSTQSLAGQPGMTGRLTIHYRSPTPLHEELLFEARVVEVSGRKTFTHGTLHAGDRLCAEGEGLFIAIDFPRLAEMQRRRDEVFGPGGERTDRGG
ncbi:MAG TPA: PaaI family thioesterase [Acidimicrobiales bacterium]